MTGGAGSWRRRPLVREAIYIVVLGPFWGTLIAYVVLAAVVPGGASPSAVAAFFPVALLVGYAIGSGPALVTAVLHCALRLRTRARFLISPVIGFAASALPMLIVPHLARRGSRAGWDDGVAVVGLFGMLSTLISLALARWRYGDVPAAEAGAAAHGLPAAGSRIAASGGPSELGGGGRSAAAA